MFLHTKQTKLGESGSQGKLEPFPWQLQICGVTIGLQFFLQTQIRGIKDVLRASRGIEENQAIFWNFPRRNPSALRALFYSVCRYESLNFQFFLEKYTFPTPPAVVFYQKHLPANLRSDLLKHFLFFWILCIFFFFFGWGICKINRCFKKKFWWTMATTVPCLLAVGSGMGHLMEVLVREIGEFAIEL